MSDVTTNPADAAEEVVVAPEAEVAEVVEEEAPAADVAAPAPAAE